MTGMDVRGLQGRTASWFLLDLLHRAACGGNHPSTHDENGPANVGMDRDVPQQLLKPKDRVLQLKFRSCLASLAFI